LLLSRLVIVDDHDRWRRHIRLLFSLRPEFQVVCEASDGLEAVQKAEELKPELILLDIGLPKISGIEAARHIRRVSPTSRIIFLTQNNDLDVLRAALGAGARGYVWKTDAQRDLLAAAEAVLRGKRFVSSSVRAFEFVHT
jgi:DNA-binding NarL/FixJ family response regulator